MKAIDRLQAERLLFPLGLRIGDWNELCDLTPSKKIHREFFPPSDALELYVASHQLATWIGLGSWTLLQIDNSTSPLDDEITVFENFAFKESQSWNLATQHTFLLDGRARKSELTLTIYFSLLFTWHVHIVSQSSSIGQRLALQDGVIYFFGDTPTITTAENLIANLVKSPRSWV